MSEEFKEQGGVATMDPSRLRRWVTSKLLTSLASESRLQRRRKTAEKHRRRDGGKHIVEYFHQVDDGYSHLAVQLLDALLERYDVTVVCHLVRDSRGANSPEPELLARLSQYDSVHIAPYYGLRFPIAPTAPDPKLVAVVESILSAQDTQGFIDLAASLGQALWSNDGEALAALTDGLPTETDAAVEAYIEKGVQRRAELGHYSAAMFHFAGEWYWGVDRLYHLEQRLADLGADRAPEHALLAPRPTVETTALRDSGTLTLELFASLRSPYTAVVFDRAVALARDTGVKLSLRPVLPMVMRGVPATREKGFYIFSDAAREARAAGVAFGRIADPIGEPVRRCYSLYLWALEQGKEVALFSSFLRCAFAEGVNTNTENGLRRVVEMAGLSWTDAREQLGRDGWQEILEANRQAMYEAGLWGVPSFRLLDESGNPVLALWGQDRLWLFAREIQRLLQQRQG